MYRNLCHISEIFFKNYICFINLLNIARKLSFRTVCFLAKMTSNYQSRFLTSFIQLYNEYKPNANDAFTQTYNKYRVHILQQIHTQFPEYNEDNLDELKTILYPYSLDTQLTNKYFPSLHMKYKWKLLNSYVYENKYIGYKFNLVDPTERTFDNMKHPYWSDFVHLVDFVKFEHPLYWAIKSKNMDFLRFFAKQKNVNMNEPINGSIGTDTTAENMTKYVGFNCLYYALLEDSVEMLRILLQEYHVDPNNIGSGIHYPFFVLYGKPLTVLDILFFYPRKRKHTKLKLQLSIEKLEMLLSTGKFIVGEKDAESIFQRVISNSKEELFDYLIKCNIHHKIKNKQSFMEFAINQFTYRPTVNIINMIHKLLDIGFIINKKDMKQFEFFQQERILSNKNSNLGLLKMHNSIVNGSQQPSKKQTPRPSIKQTQTPSYFQSISNMFRPAQKSPQQSPQKSKSPPPTKTTVPLAYDQVIHANVMKYLERPLIKTAESIDGGKSKTSKTCKNATKIKNKSRVNRKHK